jgi:sporulation protein YlmC with PRC-barrel domain
MASFGSEFLTRQVVDNNGELFGHLEDIVIDVRSGQIVELIVDVANDIDTSKLPWPMVDGKCKVPMDEVSQMAGRIHLRR